MKCDITACLDEGCDGVVIGMLKKDGTVDVDNCRELVVAAGKMDVTFHRAFDRVADPENSLEEIIAMGCKRILTSGLKPTAPEGSVLLMKLVQQAANRITIMPGSGIRAGNIRTLALATGARAFHSSARLSKASDMNYKNLEMNELLNKITLDGSEVSALRNELNTIASF
jgi:copper homeostasis protein